MIEDEAGGCWCCCSGSLTGDDGVAAVCFGELSGFLDAEGVFSEEVEEEEGGAGPNV